MDSQPLLGIISIAYIWIRIVIWDEEEIIVEAPLLVGIMQEINESDCLIKKTQCKIA